MRENRITGIFLVLLAIGYGLEASRLEARYLSDPLGPKGQPLLLAGLMGVFGLWLIIVAAKESRPQWPDRVFWMTGVFVLVSFIAYAYLLRPLGFILTTTVEVTLLAHVFGGRFPKSLAAAGAFSFALYALFVWAFELSLPAGTVFRILGVG